MHPLQVDAGCRRHRCQEMWRKISLGKIFSNDNQCRNHLTILLGINLLQAPLDPLVLSCHRFNINNNLTGRVVDLVEESHQIIQYCFQISNKMFCSHIEKKVMQKMVAPVVQAKKEAA